MRNLLHLTGILSCMVPLAWSLSADNVPSKIRSDPRWEENQKDLVRRSRLRTLGNAVLQDLPDCVAVVYEEIDVTKNPPSRINRLASGTVIGRNVVLTAGHAYVQGQPNGGLKGVFVGVDVQQPLPTDHFVKVKQAIVHPMYKHNVTGIPILENDLTVLILENEIPNCVPRGFASQAAIDAAKSILVAGYGATKPEAQDFGRRKPVEVAIASSECNGMLHAGSGAPVPDAQIYGCCAGVELVAEDPRGESDSCLGDSGGPAYVKVNENEWLLAAAVSRASEKNLLRHCGDGGIYVRVDKKLQWIKDTAGQNGGRLPE